MKIVTYTSLVGESAETGDIVVKRDVDLDRFGDEIFYLLQLVELVLALDIGRTAIVLVERILACARLALTQQQSS
jgi:hypothetical protein